MLHLLQTAIDLAFNTVFPYVNTLDSIAHMLHIHVYLGAKLFDLYNLVSPLMQNNIPLG